MALKKDRGTEEETHTPTPAIDALLQIKNRREKKKRTKKQGTGLQPSYLAPLGHLLRPAGIIRWAYSCNSPGPQGE